jgi:hypothetical protein
MNFWIAIVLLCIKDQCVFMKPDTNFYSENECAISLVSFMKQANEELPLDFMDGVCLKITNKDQT